MAHVLQIKAEFNLIKIHSTTRDEVIKSTVASGEADYAYALDKLEPLLNRFGEQRKIQSRKFYERLRSDIVAGCVMPPITLAFVNTELSNGANEADVESFVNASISEGYVLDGLQRLTTLKDAAKDPVLCTTRPIYMNIIIAERYDLLLYRMITLNNGQKPMTARHQVEMLTGPLLKNVNLKNLDINVLSEKETEGTRVPGAFRKSDIVEAYTAYLSDNVHNQNAKIIENRLDEIIVGRVMEAELTDEKFTFEDILSEVDRLSENQTVKTWLRQSNNLIGFTVGAKTSVDKIRKISPETFSKCVEGFEMAFDSINPSKVNVGKYRRDLSSFYIAGIEGFLEADIDEIEGKFFDETLSE